MLKFTAVRSPVLSLTLWSSLSASPGHFKQTDYKLFRIPIQATKRGWVIMLQKPKDVLVQTVTKAIWLKRVEQIKDSLCWLDHLSTIYKTAEIRHNPTPEENHTAPFVLILYQLVRSFGTDSRKANSDLPFLAADSRQG